MGRSILDVRVDELEISIRAANRLAGFGIGNLRELLELTGRYHISGLRAVPGIGAVAAREVAREVAGLVQSRLESKVQAGPN